MGTITDSSNVISLTVWKTLIRVTIQQAEKNPTGSHSLPLREGEMRKAVALGVTFPASPTL